MFRLRPPVFGLALSGLIFLAPSQAAEAQTPSAAVPTRSASEVVQTLHDTLTEAMARSAKLGCEGRLALLAPVIDSAFDIPFLAERALRRHWKTLAPEQQQRFVTSLRQSFATTYATEFASPGAVRFESGKSETLASGDALVHTTLRPASQTGIGLDYVLKPRDSGWQIVNVLADGVSDLALRATQYDTLMKAQGFDALIARLDGQTAKLKARCK